ncbi:MAG: type III polyketide synthase [Nannocystaceae bacterium]|nr:stilbene synthase [bacterium]
MTPRVLSVGTASPAYEVPQAESKAFAKQFFAGSLRALDRMLGAFDNTCIERRQLVRPLSWYAEPHPFHEKNAVYCEAAIELSVRAAQQALARAKLSPSDVDAVVFVSTTGIRTPSIDGALIERLQLRRDTVRLPVWGLGCAGGAAGLARAAELVRARGKPVLLVTAEVCSATFVHGDRTKANLIATALFGDGAAAAVLAPAERGLGVVGSVSHLLEDSEDVMGWTVVEEGLRVRFARSIPAIVRDVVPQMRTRAAAAVGLPPEALTRFILHPGGAKVLDAYQEALGVEAGALGTAYDVLREHGNMSSPTVLFVLERFLAEQTDSDEHGLVLGLGPGFSAEGVVVRWTP